MQQLPNENVKLSTLAFTGLGKLTIEGYVRILSKPNRETLKFLKKQNCCYMIIFDKAILICSIVEKSLFLEYQVLLQDCIITDENDFESFTITDQSQSDEVWTMQIVEDGDDWIEWLYNHINYREKLRLSQGENLVNDTEEDVEASIG
ncbi:hypothetical protein TrispH2_006241 [Trichoplax sp. H2]|nr:hypothetical protein TrispH2_006241 [Trichoplax sp. H2]|eukprot:RDD40770.1 hypothetical protein TrispH2_006241 [Trichoplax sp. H2]